jgi:hypothetical protein
MRNYNMHSERQLLDTLTLPTQPQQNNQKQWKFPIFVF